MCTCTSRHEFISNQISFPLSLFTNTFSEVRNLALIFLNICTHLFSIRTLLNALSSFPPLSSSLYYFLRHCTYHCPTSSATAHAATTTHLHETLLPLPTHLLRCYHLSPGEQGKAWWEIKGREDHHLCLFTDGWIWGTPRCFSQHICICVE